VGVAPVGEPPAAVVERCEPVAVPPEPVVEPAGLEPTWLAPVVGLLPVLVLVLVVLVGLPAPGVLGLGLVLVPNSKA
jgi:hypothetical protein